MRRYIYLILFAVVLIAPFLLQWWVGADMEQDGAAAAGRIVIVTPHNQDIRREFARKFTAWHQNKYGQTIAIEYRMPGGTNDIKRLLETSYPRDAAGKLTGERAVDIDLIWGGGDFFFDKELKPLGLLQPLQLDPQMLKEAFPQPALAGVKLYDFDKDANGNPLPPQWVGVCLSSFGIVYNPDLYRAIGLPHPQTWHDLTHEKLAGLIALADPSHSGSAAVAYMMVIQRAMADAEAAYLSRQPLVSAPQSSVGVGFKPTLFLSSVGAGFQPALFFPVRIKNPPPEDDPAYQAAIAAGWKRGMGELLLIAANARYFTDSANQVPKDVSTGEAAAGMAIDFYARVTAQTAGPARVQFISPAAATAITPDPVGILQGVQGDRLTWANHFVEFLLTPEAQQLWIVKAGQPNGPRDRSLRRPPIRRDVYDNAETRQDWADDVNPFAEAGGFNQRGQWMALFTDTRPLWAAAWIDSREALKEAYQRILDIKDDVKRAKLIADLADLPIEMEDIENLRAQRKQIEQSQGNARHWIARQRIEWANRFRQHYAAVADKAGG